MTALKRSNPGQQAVLTAEMIESVSLVRYLTTSDRRVPLSVPSELVQPPSDSQWLGRLVTSVLRENTINAKPHTHLMAALEGETMIVETIQLHSGRSITELAAALELVGGALVVLRRKRGMATTANLYLPADDARQAQCRRAIDDWTRGALPSQPSAFWPLGHPRHVFTTLNG